MKILLQLLFIALFSIQSLMAWGKTGHRIVGKVAEQHLTKNAKQEINKILGHSDLSRVSNWADEIKSDPNWKHAWDWHFCTIPDEENFISGKYDGIAIEKMNDFITTLKDEDSSLKEKKIALKFMVHLVGDLHQPLHVGNGKDRGGNDIKVDWFYESSNLHSIWDTKLIEHQKLSFTEYTHYLMLNINDSKIEQWKNDTLMTYVYESKKLRKECYNFSGETLKWTYFYQNKNLLEQRLLQGGIRLAGQLNRVFK